MHIKPHMRFLLLTALSASTLLISACSAPPKKVVLPADDFLSTDVFSQSFPGTDQEACEAARRALLSQGYVIQEARDALVRGRKNFQAESDVHVQIEFHVTCAPNARGSNSSTVFANAVRDRYTLKRVKESASIGVGVLGSVSLPYSSSVESLVRVASETIPSKQFYARFFGLMERYIDNSFYPQQQDTQEMDSAAVEVVPVR